MENTSTLTKIIESRAVHLYNKPMLCFLSFILRAALAGNLIVSNTHLLLTFRPMFLIYTLVAADILLTLFLHFDKKWRTDFWKKSSLSLLICSSLFVILILHHENKIIMSLGWFGCSVFTMGIIQWTLSELGSRFLNPVENDELTYQTIIFGELGWILGMILTTYINSANFFLIVNILALLLTIALIQFHFGSKKNYELFKSVTKIKGPKKKSFRSASLDS